MTHKLNENPSYPHVKQKKRKQGTFKNQVIRDEVQKLLNIGYIREVKYPNWLVNTVVVPKKNGYNQIKMDPVDEEKTSFTTDRGTYCYKVMPFVFKNAGSTYQRLVTKIFQEHLGQTMEFYIDDMLIKTQHSGDHISHPFDAFQILQKFNMKLNPEKCAFGVASDAETWYPQLEKLALALIMASRILRPYFQCHHIVVVTAYPLRNILHKHELPGRLAKYAVELSEYDITYQPRTTIKSQVLADFVADFSQGMQLEAEKELQVFNGSNPGIWTLFTNGSSNVKCAGLGIVSVPPAGETIRQAIKYHSITNNEAEHEALVVNQMLGTYTAREARMQQYLEKVRDLIRQFQTWKVMQISRDKNVEADALANLTSAADVASNENASVIHLFHSVLDPDKNEYGTIPEDKKKAHALQKKAARYCLKQGNRYQKMFGGPLARCLGPSQTEYIMREIHEGHCGNYAGGRSLVRTMIRAGYYWPKMEE
ncbi:uncharacterized protein [Nicotiana sylvestris]|uniref:uncharacterized protein n=1 Tax=Nicotiana sylvestris TaxID=4096 RepID=UPI00388C85D0